jgi:hypothetical protein
MDCNKYCIILCLDDTFDISVIDLGSLAENKSGRRLMSFLKNLGKGNNVFSTQDTGSNSGGNRADNINGILASPDSSIQKFNVITGRVYKWTRKTPNTGCP